MLSAKKNTYRNFLNISRTRPQNDFLLILQLSLPNLLKSGVKSSMKM